MAYRKKTLRVMSPTARKVARLIGELESVSRRLKTLIPDLQRLDFESKALKSAKEDNLPSAEVACSQCQLKQHCQDLGIENDSKECRTLIWHSHFTDADRQSGLGYPDDLPDILSYESTGIPRPEL